MLEIISNIKQRVAEAMSESSWRDYIHCYCHTYELMDTYKVTKEDHIYSKALINKGFSDDWSKIKLPEIY